MNKTPQTPWEILGVPEDVDVRQLKRAYAAQIKKHPPETDPEGFQKVRQAYEWLKDSLDGSHNRFWARSHAESEEEPPERTSEYGATPEVREAEAKGTAFFNDFHEKTKNAPPETLAAILVELSENSDFWSHPATYDAFFARMGHFYQDRSVIPYFLLPLLIDRFHFNVRLAQLTEPWSNESQAVFLRNLRASWQEAMAAKLTPLWEAFETGLESGDTNWAQNFFKSSLADLITSEPLIETSARLFILQSLGDAFLPRSVILDLAETYDLDDFVESHPLLSVIEPYAKYSRFVLEKTKKDEPIPGDPAARLSDSFRDLGIWLLILIMVPMFLRSNACEGPPRHLSNSESALSRQLKSLSNRPMDQIFSESKLERVAYLAILIRKDDMLEEALRKGLDPNTSFPGSPLSPLMVALNANNLNAAALLIKHGADTNLSIETGYAPLHYAIFLRRPDYAKFLIEHGANPHLVPRNLNQSPLMLAKESGLTTMVEAMQSPIP